MNGRPTCGEFLLCTIHADTRTASSYYTNSYYYIAILEVHPSRAKRILASPSRSMLLTTVSSTKMVAWRRVMNPRRRGNTPSLCAASVEISSRHLDPDGGLQAR